MNTGLAIGGGIVILAIGFFIGVAAVLLMRRRASKSTTVSSGLEPSVGVEIENEKQALSAAQTDSRSSIANQTTDLLMDNNSQSNTAIFEVNIDYQEEMLQIVPHSPHEIRLDQFSQELGYYIPIIITKSEATIEEVMDESYLTYKSRLNFCADGAKEPQFNIYVAKHEAADEEKSAALPILGICVHHKALIVYELLKRKQKHHILIQRARTISDPFSTIFVGNAKGKVNVKHNRRGIFRILIWWSADGSITADMAEMPQ